MQQFSAFQPSTRRASSCGSDRLKDALDRAQQHGLIDDTFPRSIEPDLTLLLRSSYPELTFLSDQQLYWLYCDYKTSSDSSGRFDADREMGFLSYVASFAK